MALNRDQSQGSDIDMTKGVAAGPFGSPIRYDEGYGEVGGNDDSNSNNMTAWDMKVSE